MRSAIEINTNTGGLRFRNMNEQPTEKVDNSKRKKTVRWSSLMNKEMRKFKQNVGTLNTKVLASDDKLHNAWSQQASRVMPRYSEEPLTDEKDENEENEENYEKDEKGGCPCAGCICM